MLDVDRFVAHKSDANSGALVDDISVMPIAISYEKVLEAELYSNELLVRSQKNHLFSLP